MKNIKLSQTFWYVAPLDKIDEVLKNGIDNPTKKCILIHKKELGFYGDYSDEKISVSDYFATCLLGRIEKLKYALIKIDPTKLNGKIKKRHTRGIVESNCTYIFTGEHIDKTAIIGFEIKKINLEMLFYYNSVRLRNVMFLSEISTNETSLRNRKIEEHNSRLNNEKHEALWFNEWLIVEFGNHRLFKGDFKKKN
jgi:hypothetical protein